MRACLQLSEWLHLFARHQKRSNEDYPHLGSGINESGTNLVLGTQVTF